MKQTRAHESAKPTADAQSAATGRVNGQATNSRAPFGLLTTPAGGVLHGSIWFD